jgi:hypothetical protein
MKSSSNFSMGGRIGSRMGPGNPALTNIHFDDSHSQQNLLTPNFNPSGVLATPVTTFS